jgi:hypothetical protein
MLKEYRHSHDANTACAGAAAITPERADIWAPIERAKQLAIRGLRFSLLSNWSVGEEACLDPDEERQVAEKDCLQRRPSRPRRGLRVQ